MGRCPERIVVLGWEPNSKASYRMSLAQDGDFVEISDQAWKGPLRLRATSGTKCEPRATFWTRLGKELRVVLDQAIAEGDVLTIQSTAASPGYLPPGSYYRLRVLEIRSGREP